MFDMVFFASVLAGLILIEVLLFQHPDTKQRVKNHIRALLRQDARKLAKEVAQLYAETGQTGEASAECFSKKIKYIRHWGRHEVEKSREQRVVDLALRAVAREFTWHCDEQTKARKSLEHIKKQRVTARTHEINYVYNHLHNCDKEVNRVKLEFWTIHALAKSCGFRVWDHHEVYLSWVEG